MADTPQEIVDRELREYKRYTGDGQANEPVGAPLPVGDPASGVWNPKKANLRRAVIAPLAETMAARDEAVAAAPSTWQDLRNETVEARDDASEQRVLAETARSGSEAALASANTVLDSTQLAAASVGYFADTTAGISGTTDGETFWTIEGEEMVYYENDSGTAVMVPGASLALAAGFGSAENLLVLTDAAGVPYVYVDAKGHLFLTGMKENVQETLAPLGKNEGRNIADFRDATGITVGFLDATGTLHVRDVATEGGSVEARLGSVISPSTETIDSREVLMLTDHVRTASMEETNTQNTFFDAADIEDYASVFGPAIVRLSRTEFFVAAEARKDGFDYTPIKIVGRTATFDPDTRGWTLGPIITIADDGEDEGVPYTFLNICLTLVETGPYAGRIWMHFNRMTNPPDGVGRTYTPYSAYSDDGGSTFSSPMDISDQFPMEVWKLLIFGPGHGIQIRHGDYAGRIILPAYRATTDFPDSNTYRAVPIISDDGGTTLTAGGEMGVDLVSGDYVGLNEWQVAEDWKGDLLAVLRIYSNRTEKYSARSSDGGASWSDPAVIPEISGAGTKVALTQCASRFDGALPKMVAINPRDEDDLASLDRINPHAWLSYDGGNTWPHVFKVASGICQYAEVVGLDENSILVLYGGGTHPRGDKILAHEVSINNLIGASI